MRNTNTNQTEFDRKLSMLEQICTSALARPRMSAFRRALKQMQDCNSLVENQLLEIHEQLHDEIRQEKPDLLNNLEATQADDGKNLAAWRKYEAELAAALVGGDNPAFLEQAERILKAIASLVSKLRMQEDLLVACQFSLQEDSCYLEYAS